MFRRLFSSSLYPSFQNGDERAFSAIPVVWFRSLFRIQLPTLRPKPACSVERPIFASSRRKEELGPPFAFRSWSLSFAFLFLDSCERSVSGCSRTLCWCSPASGCLPAFPADCLEIFQRNFGHKEHGWGIPGAQRNPTLLLNSDTGARSRSRA